MSYEIEVKFRAINHAALADRLRELGAAPEPADHQSDIYFQHPSRDFAATNEAFRLRHSAGQTRVTYKGPKLAGPTKTREEIEFPIAHHGPEGLEQARTLLARLGFQEVATVRKLRRLFRLSVDGRDAEIALDDAGPLGFFAEVELIAEHEHDIEDVRAAVLGLAAQLGLEPDAIEPRSYLSMTLAAAGL